MYEAVKTFLLGTLPALLNGSTDAFKARSPQPVPPPPATCG